MRLVFHTWISRYLFFTPSIFALDCRLCFSLATLHVPSEMWFFFLQNCNFYLCFFPTLLIEETVVKPNSFACSNLLGVSCAGMVAYCMPLQFDR
jgi:hypothetical protein